MNPHACHSPCLKKSVSILFKVGKVCILTNRGPLGCSLSGFLQHEVTRSISTPPGWDPSPLQGSPQH